MGDLDEFFSPEALRLLDEFSNPHSPFLQPNDRLGGDGYVNSDPRITKTTNQKSDNHACDIPGYMTLDFTDRKAKRKRANFDDAGRAKVADVRKKGACMRCRLLKIPCSGGWPCQTCIRSQASCHGREPKHSWMACIPFSFKQVDIFTIDFPCTQDKYNAIISAFDFIINGDAERTFKSEFLWNLDAVSSDCAKWICEEHVNPTSISRVWMLSSLQAEDLLSNLVDPDLSKALRVLVETSSILYNWGDDVTFSRYGSSDLWSIRSFAGSQALRHLEAFLTNNRLAKFSKDVLKALFLILLGTIIAVGYTDSVSQKDERGEPPHSTVEVFIEAREQLLRILAHHMILIAERIGLLGDDNAKDGLLKRAHCQWSEKAVFEWQLCPALASPSFLTCGGYSTIGDVAPDQFHSTLDHTPTDYSTSSDKEYSDSGAQGDSHPEAFLIHENEASSNLHQSASVFNSTTRRVSGTPWPTPYLDDDWSFWNASHDKTDKNYQPPSQNSIGNLPFGYINSPYDDSSLSAQCETQRDPSNPSQSEYDLAQALIAPEPPKSTMNNQTFEGLERADPTFNVDINAAMDNDRASPTEYSNSIPFFQPAVPATLPKVRRENPNAFYKWNVVCYKATSAQCIKCHLVDMSSHLYTYSVCQRCTDHIHRYPKVDS